MTADRGRFAALVALDHGLRPYDRVVRDERRTAVLVVPGRVHSNPG